MHLNIIKHFLDKNLDLILAKSLINCHAIGVDSILLDDTPGARIRMFIANENHELHKNHKFAGNISVAIHPHHCDLTLIPIRGAFENILFLDKPKEGMTYLEYEFDEYLYNSKITGSKCKFVKQGKKTLLFNGSMWHSPNYNGYLEMAANTLHTVCAVRGQLTAWAVYEEKEDKNYQPVCYSNQDLTKFDDSLLYKKMDKEYLFNVLRKVYPNL